MTYLNVYFGSNQCTIKFNNKVMGFAPRQDMLYMLSLNDFPVMNVCDVTNKREKKIILAIMRLLRNYGTVIYAIFRVWNGASH
jgi:hypothetical protein